MCERETQLERELKRKGSMKRKISRPERES